MELTQNELVALLNQTAAKNAEGSYSERNPILGKMANCPQCGRRHRKSESCGTVKYIKTNEAEVSRASVAKKRKNPRLSRNRPPHFAIHCRLKEIEAHPAILDGRTFTEDGLVSFVEKTITAERVAKRRAKRKQSRTGRKANRRNG